MAGSSDPQSYYTFLSASTTSQLGKLLLECSTRSLGSQGYRCSWAVGFPVVCRILAVLSCFRSGVGQELGSPERKELAFLEPTSKEEA